MNMNTRVSLFDRRFWFHNLPSAVRIVFWRLVSEFGEYILEYILEDRASINILQLKQ
jgi:hypothetical protein